MQKKVVLKEYVDSCFVLHRLRKMHLDDFYKQEYVIVGLQTSNADATTANGYPANRSGKLVSTSIHGFIYQEYHTYGSDNIIYHRTYHSSTGWSRWKTVQSL